MELQRAQVRKDRRDQVSSFQRDLVFRVSIGAATLAFCVLLHVTGLVWLPVRTLCVLCSLVILVNIPYYYLLPRSRNLHSLVTLFCAVDSLIITGIVHLTGGVNASILVMGYPLIIIYAGITLPTYSSYVIAFCSVVLYGLLLGIEQVSGFSMVGAANRFSGGYMVGRLVAASALLLITAWFSANFSRKLKAKNLELEKSENRYRLLAENVSDCIWTTETNLKFTYASPSVEKLLGYSPEEMVGRTLIECVTPESVGIAARILAEEMVAGGIGPDRPFRSSTMELEFKRKDESTVWAEVQASFLRDPDGRPSRIIGVARDVTERRRLGEQLRQAQKMEAIGRLAGGISHDFNNVLTAIIGYSDLILHRLGEESPVAREINTIKLAGERAASLTRQLLTFSRRQILLPKILDLNEVVRESGKILKPLIGEDIEFRTDLDTALHPVKADHGQIVQVILNLAVNARDAMSEGGTITVRTRNVTLEEQDCLAIPDSRPGEFACLEMEDTGVGMEAATLERIFEPFFTTKGSGKGTGLGLSVVYGIVKQHNGWITVRSEPGEGAAFKVYLPAQSGTQLVKRSGEAASLQGLQGRGERILLVEDEDHVREYTKAILRENGYVIFEAANPEEALDVFRREKGYFHLVFSDVVMPGKSGVQLADQLLAQRPDVSVLLSSGYTDERSQWPIIRDRGYRYLQKPYSLVDLLQTVREMVTVN